MCLYSWPFPPCSEMLNSDEEQGTGGVNERETERGGGEEGEGGKRVDLASACSHDKLHSEWADSLLKYA